MFTSYESKDRGGTKELLGFIDAWEVVEWKDSILSLYGAVKAECVASGTSSPAPKLNSADPHPLQVYRWKY